MVSLFLFRYSSCCEVICSGKNQIEMNPKQLSQTAPLSFFGRGAGGEAIQRFNNNLFQHLHSYCTLGMLKQVQHEKPNYIKRVQAKPKPSVFGSVSGFYFCLIITMFRFMATSSLATRPPASVAALYFKL